jgi:Flp pilus assembly protein TadB
VASQNQKRRARKRRNPASAPRAVPSQRREVRAEVRATSARQASAGRHTLGAVGERPPSPFGGVPVSEIAIFAGLVTVIVWLASGAGTATLVVGVVIMALGVLEFTVREHFSGYKSHTILLAALPAIVIALSLVTVTGENAGHAPLLFSAVPIFALLFWPLKRRFELARQARIARPQAPRADS